MMNYVLLTQIAILLLATTIAVLAEFKDVIKNSAKKTFRIVAIVLIAIALFLQVAVEILRSLKEEADKISQENDIANRKAKANETLDKIDTSLNKIKVIQGKIDSQLSILKESNDMSKSLLLKSNEIVKSQNEAYKNSSRIIDPLVPLTVRIYYEASLNDQNLKGLKQYALHVSDSLRLIDDSYKTVEKRSDDSLRLKSGKSDSETYAVLVNRKRFNIDINKFNSYLEYGKRFSESNYVLISKSNDFYYYKSALSLIDPEDQSIKPIFQDVIIDLSNEKVLVTLSYFTTRLHSVGYKNFPGTFGFNDLLGSYIAVDNDYLPWGALKKVVLVVKSGLKKEVSITFTEKNAFIDSNGLRKYKKKIGKRDFLTPSSALF
jgi:hypothetical protein